jgi:bifunctional enzyme CysN/CysC
MTEQESAESAKSSQQLNIVIVGHVDHGKSTLVGRLLYDTDSLPEGKYEQIKASSEKRGMPFEWSFLMDALQVERDQAITVDTTQIWFKTQARDYCIIDAPGHKEFLKNMITGAANSEAALLLIDAKEGVKEQSKRHGYLLHLLGVKQIAVAVNKMDLIDYDEQRYSEVEAEYREYLKSIGIEPIFMVPISAREGNNIAEHSAKMVWYNGPTILEALDRFSPLPVANDLPLRFPVQDVYKFDERRIIVGRVESGNLQKGDEIVFSPTNTKATIASIESWNASTLPEAAYTGQSIGITLTDQIFVERGHVASHVKDAPYLTNRFRARIFWLGHKPLETGKRYRMKLSTSEYIVEVEKILHVIDTDDLGEASAEKVERNGVAEVQLRIRGMAALDAFEDNPALGRFVLVDQYDIQGGGIIDASGLADMRVQAQEIKSQNVFNVDLKITTEQRALANGHAGGILWFTGLSGSGKSTLALELQQRLFQKGYQAYVLDGDNIRQGLNADLGFAPEDRTENIRRVGEVASLFAKAGFIVISAFISPYREDRRRARAAAPEYFHNVYIKADVETCEQRDVKGLYAKARAGEIKEFTGISAPYEEPENPELAIDTQALSVDASVEQLLAYVERQFVDPVRDPEHYSGNFLAQDI